MIAAGTCDTHNLCEYDVARGTYVAYVRDHVMGLRTVSRTESTDYAGAPVPHKHSRHHPYGGPAWALWERDRLVALEVEDESCFATCPLLTHGRRVRINHRTKATGYVRVEVRDANGDALPGRAADDCDLVRGNEYDRLVTWRGESGLSAAPDAALSLHIGLRHAELFAIRFADE